MVKFVRRLMDIFDEIIVSVWFSDSEVCFVLTNGCGYGWSIENFHECNKAKSIWSILSHVSRETRRNAR